MPFIKVSDLSIRLFRLAVYLPRDRRPEPHDIRCTQSPRLKCGNQDFRTLDSSLIRQRFLCKSLMRNPCREPNRGYYLARPISCYVTIFDHRRTPWHPGHRPAGGQGRVAHLNLMIPRICPELSSLTE